MCFFFKIKFIGWHWLIRSYWFQIHISVVHDLYMYCVPVTQSQIIFHHHEFGPLCPLLTPHPLLVTVVYAFQFYVPYMSEIIWFLAFSDLLRLACYSQDSSMLSQVAVFHLFWLSVFHCVYVPRPFDPVLYRRTVRLSPRLRHGEWCCTEQGLHISWRRNGFKYFG